MTTHPATRRYALHISNTGAHVSHSGPQNVLSVASGQALEKAIGLAGLLFPICPRAHQIAALRAAEDAMGLILPKEQRIARDIALLGEGVFSAVWRAALSWAKLTDADLPTHAVQKAREANAAMPAALSDDALLCVGGAHLNPDTQALRAHAISLAKAFYEIRPIGVKTAGLAHDIALDLGHHSAACGEETPRTLFCTPPQPKTLAPWFEAQLDHAEGLLMELYNLCDEAKASAPVDLAQKRVGTGSGIAMTARGRLEHTLSVEDGCISGWSYVAPTDRNFADDGPAARIAQTLGAANTHAAAWLIAAFDPCAPCDIIVESAHA